MRAPTLKDVAHKAGVGVVTASTVLNGASTQTRVSQATRQRILDAAAELRYHPNAMARGLRRRQTQTLGVLFDNPTPFTLQTNPHTSAIMEGILTTGREKGYNVLIFTPEWESAKSSAPLFRDHSTDGIIVIAPRRHSDTVSGLCDLGIPVVVASAPAELPGVPWVDVDNVRGAQLVADHLADLGHRRVAYLPGDESQYSVGERREALFERLLGRGILECADYCVPGTFSSSQLTANIELLLKLPNRPTAVFATNDNMAIALLRIAREHGIKVPEQLSVVGFDDVPLARYVTPQLTSVRHPIAEVGRWAAETLIRKLNTPVRKVVHDVNEEEVEASEVQGMRLMPELVVRGTTAPAPK
ncbi:MAG: LacI family DNA-binding transcriptional regulator [Armatimonadaceae bacterium]